MLINIFNFFIGTTDANFFKKIVVLYKIENGFQCNLGTT